MPQVDVSILQMVFGFASLLGFGFAVYIHYKSKAEINSLLERLRASRSNFIQIGMQVDRIITVAGKDTNDLKEKLYTIEQLAKAISRTNHTNINTIDNGVDWGKLTQREILIKIK